MPNCFSFISRETKQAESLAVIDDKLRVFLGAPPNPDKYYRGWYDTIGLWVAMGKTFAEIKTRYPNDDEDDAEVHRILDWFDANYTTDAWYAPK